MGKILAIANQKGGVGKTTTAVNLGAALAQSRRRVLLVDMDPQGNATVGSGVVRDELELSVYDALLDPAVAAAAVVRRDSGHHILPAHDDLAGAQVELLDMDEQRYFRLQQVLRGAGEYDYVLVDCPPSLNILTVNALAAAHGVLIPVQCEYYSLEGLAALTRTIDRIRDSLNKSLVIEGMLRTMHDTRNALSREVSEQVARYFGDKVYRTIVPRNVRLAEAPGHGMSVLAYDMHSSGATAYLALAGEILKKENRT